jgi:DNA-binding transcriptional ArsR family regulator
MWNLFHSTLPIEAFSKQAVLSEVATEPEHARNQERRNKSCITLNSVPALRRKIKPIYALTSICSVGYIKRVESVFEIIAEPNRRAILSLLVSSQQSVGEIERQLRMPQPTVSKHLRVLREAGFVESTVDAQRRLYRLKPEPLQEMDAWLAQFRRFWSAHLDALERHLDRMNHDRKEQTRPDQSTTPKRKTKEKTSRPKLRT